MFQGIDSDLQASQYPVNQSTLQIMCRTLSHLPSFVLLDTVQVPSWGSASAWIGEPLVRTLEPSAMVCTGRVLCYVCSLASFRMQREVVVGAPEEKCMKPEAPWDSPL